MNTIANQIARGKILVSDGAWGTFLQQKGLGAGQCPELWNLDRPNEVLEIAQSYITAGADMIETNSFGGSSFKLSSYGLSDKVYEINKAAAEISRSAAGKDRYVLGSIGPSGKIIMTGEVTIESLYNAFKQQAIALHDGGADALVIETMSDIEEAKAAISAAVDGTKCEVICTMTFEKTDVHAYHTMMGVTPAQMTEELVRTGVAVIGANCGNGIRDMIGIVREIRRVNKTIPVLIHANAGAPVYRDGKTVFPESPQQMAEFIGELIDAGANIIGGCCGTTPEHIKRIAEIVKLKNNA
ncbi:MAG: homocysteine S-methyltransferase family protein [Bacteroidales bacterium]